MERGDVRGADPGLQLPRLPAGGTERRDHESLI